MPPASGGRIPDALYAELCGSIRSICAAADRLPVEPVSLDEWRRWAAGILSGLYYRKTAQRALDAARRARRRADHLPEIWLAEGAARIADAVLLAIEGRHGTASAMAAQAASLGQQSRAADRCPQSRADRPAESGKRC